MKIWIVKYALTKGIYCVEGETSTNYEQYYTVPGEYNLLRKNRDAFDNENDAIQHAKKVLSKRLASLKKQIARLEKLNFLTN